MLRVAVLALLSVGVFSQSFHDVEWSKFKSNFKKIYSPVEEVMRRQIFEENLDFIERHNNEFNAGKHTYTLGVNAFADMTNKEFRKTMNGYRMELKKESDATFLPPNHVTDLPPTVDWRNKGYVTPVKDQKQCGSCWAFSATGSLEGQHFRATGKLISLSEQNLVDCSRKEGNMGCDGGLMDQAFTYIKRNRGIDTEKSYPYFAKDMTCRFQRADVGATDVGFVDIQKDSEKDLQMAVATVGPISVAIDASHISFQLYKDGVYNEPQCSSVLLDHGVLAVGYGTQNNTDYWLVKNSWNTGWGMQGYIMMSRNRENQCGIATAASYPTV